MTTQPSNDCADKDRTIAAARQRCHMLIEQIPDAGIEESEKELMLICQDTLNPYVYVPINISQPPVPAILVATRIREVVPASSEDL